MAYKYNNITLKRAPEDFVVEEVCDLKPAVEGEYDFYLLKKRNATTWDVLGDIARRIRCPIREIGWGGLKDKRAVTYQYISIKGGPKKEIKGRNYTLTHLGRLPFPMSRRHVLGNRFSIIVHTPRVYPETVLKERAHILMEKGMVNYFDEQRFASVKDGEFAVREIVRKRYSRALYLLLCSSSHYEWERGSKFRRCVETHWGDLGPCVEFAPSGWEKRLVEFLSSRALSNTTLKKALSMVDREYLFMLCNAYQSYIWNKVAALYTSSLGIPIWGLKYSLGEMYFYTGKSCDNILSHLRELYIPLPGPKTEIGEGGLLRDVYLKVLQEEGIGSIKQFRCRVVGAVFRSTRRRFICFPGEMEVRALERRRYRIRFFLPSGSYATLVIRYLFSLQGMDNQLES